MGIFGPSLKEQEEMALRQVEHMMQVTAEHQLRKHLEGNQASKDYKTCDYCGVSLTKDFGGKCQECKDELCKKCIKRCKKCSKIYCPKHIKNHKCKK